jgi:hypothetical protein
VTIDEQGAGEQGDAEQDGDLLAHHLGGDGDGADQGGQTQDQGNIGDVGAIGIAERKAGIALGGRQRGDHHLGAEVPKPMITMPISSGGMPA